MSGLLEASMKHAQAVNVSGGVKMRGLSKLALASVLVWGTLFQGAWAATQYVDYGNRVASATVATPLNSGDTLFLDTFTTEVGALLQTTTFTLGPDVGSFTGNAAWLVRGAADAGPRLVGVNIDVLDSLDNVVASDSFVGLLANFAHSVFDLTGIAPGTYRVVATGTGVRDSSLDISLTFANAIPEPAAIAMMIAGLVAVGALSQRKRT
jgi:hypothetical protein